MRRKEIFQSNVTCNQSKKARNTRHQDGGGGGVFLGGRGGIYSWTDMSVLPHHLVKWWLIICCRDLHGINIVTISWTHHSHVYHETNMRQGASKS